MHSASPAANPSMGYIPEEGDQWIILCSLYIDLFPAKGKQYPPQTKPLRGCFC